MPPLHLTAKPVQIGRNSSRCGTFWYIFWKLWGGASRMGISAPLPVQCAHWTTFPIPSVSLRSTSSLPPLAFGHFPLTGGIGPLIRGVGPPGGRLAARRVVAPYSNKGTRSGGAVRTPPPTENRMIHLNNKNRGGPKGPPHIIRWQCHSCSFSISITSPTRRAWRPP